MTLHPNALLIERLYAALHRHDAAAMAECYCDDGVVFHDIAFHIERKPRLDGMWRMICEGESGIEVTVEHVAADDHTGEAHIIDRYWFGKDSKNGKAGVRITNEITSRFRFRGGRIAQHIDDCDEAAWAKQAIGGPVGWLAGRIRLMRSLKADKKLKQFLEDHPAPAARPRPTERV
jgi:ketosteroid isomerase-like protein